MTTTKRWRSVAMAAALSAALAAGLAGCGSGGDDDGRFATGNESAYPLGCLEHQMAKPGQAYTGGENAETTTVLKMLRYYTANKAVRAFCDGKGPSDTDRRWAELYVELGSEPAHVAHLLG